MRWYGRILMEDPAAPVAVGDGDDNEMPTQPDPLGPLNAVGAFVQRFGLPMVLALAFVWWALDDRANGQQATALQMKDLNGQLLHVSGLLVEHHEAEKSNAAEIRRILLAQCVNSAQAQEQRERCLGWR